MLLDIFRSGMESVMGANVAKALTAVVNEQTVTLGGHEVGVAVNVRRRVKPRQNLVHERLHLLIRTSSPEVRDPDRTAGRNFARILDVLLEVGGIGRVIIPK